MNGWEPYVVPDNRPPDDQHDPPSRVSRHDLTPCVTRLSEVTPERITWLWRGYIPIGYATVLEGDPDVGKSTTTLDLAARVTTGDAMPDGSRGLDGPHNVLLLTAEDGLADVVVHRVQLAGADLARLYHVGDLLDSDSAAPIPLTLPTHAEQVGALVSKYQAPLLIVDVLSAYMAPGVKLISEQDARTALRPLQAFAHRHGCALLLIRHLTKTGGSQAVYRGAGAISVIGASRSALLFARDAQDETRRVVVPVKHNLSKPYPALGYRLAAADADADYAVVQWLGPVDYDATTLLAEAAADPVQRGMTDELVMLLRMVLDDSGGEAPAADVIKELRKVGVDPSKDTLYRARKRAGIATRKSDLRGGWVWFYAPEGST